MKILTYPSDSKALRVVASPVTKEMVESPEFKAKLAEMAELAKKDGIGLAATQVGWNVQVFMLLVNRNLEKLSEPVVIVNPKIVEVSEEIAKAKEGCLSFPGLDLDVTRPKTIKWEGENLAGERTTSEETYAPGPAGYYIRVIQHETDHLNGKLMVDHVSSTERLKFERWLKKRLK